MINIPISIENKRQRYQGLKEPYQYQMEVFCGEAKQINVKKNTLISITNLEGAPAILITALVNDSRNFTTKPFELSQSKKINLNKVEFDKRIIKEIINARNTKIEHATACRIFDGKSKVGEEFVFKIKKNAKLFAIVPNKKNALSKGGGGQFRIRIQQENKTNNNIILPEPLGKICNEWRIIRGTAKAYQIKKGQFVQIIDVEGQQCSDFMAMRAEALENGLERYIDSTVSRTMTRSAYPMPGLQDKFFDQDIRPLLAVRQDTVGRHDTFALACTARGYEERGFPGHINCSDNITNAYKPYGIKPRKAWPAINFFFNSWIDREQNYINADEAWSRPGDYVVMQALTDLVCVSTACPDDVDPINGWNPTDIHVRIYEENTSISHAVAWREHPEDTAKLTKHSPFHLSTSKYTRHYNVIKDLWLPVQYDATGAVEEYWGCRNNAALQDMSSLKKYDIVGPDAEELLQYCLTRNITKLSQHRGLYALICNNQGSIIDDGTLFRLEPTAFRWCCGSHNSALHLREQAEKLKLNVRVLSYGQKMPNLALQGPKSRDILRELVFTQPSRPTLDNLKWFGFTIARLHDREGPMFMLSRTGFTGELGYEIFCSQNDAIQIWDAIMHIGKKYDIVPMGTQALNILRIEAALMSAGAEFTPDVDAFEAGLEFVVDFNKGDFIGRAALERNHLAPRRKLVGLVLAGNEIPLHGDGVFLQREQIGVITSACFSPQLGHAIAMARIAVENSSVGTQLEIGKLDGHMKRLKCSVNPLPFIDQNREKPRS